MPTPAEQTTMDVKVQRESKTAAKVEAWSVFAAHALAALMTGKDAGALSLSGARENLTRLAADYADAMLQQRQSRYQ